MAGAYLVPTNQLLRPWGTQMLFPGRPVDIAYDSKKRLLAVLNTRSVLLIDSSAATQVAEIKSRLGRLLASQLDPHLRSNPSRGVSARAWRCPTPLDGTMLRSLDDD